MCIHTHVYIYMVPCIYIHIIYIQYTHTYTYVWHIFLHVWPQDMPGYSVILYYIAAYFVLVTLVLKHIDILTWYHFHSFALWHVYLQYIIQPKRKRGDRIHNWYPSQAVPKWVGGRREYDMAKADFQEGVAWRWIVLADMYKGMRTQTRTEQHTW